jgi:hypothetical protein
MVRAVVIALLVSFNAVRALSNTSLCPAIAVIPRDWYAGRKMGPPLITRPAELAALGKYVAPVLYGGLGNELFQLAALHVYARSLG